MNITSIMLSTGQTLNIGDTFYFVHPEYHDGTIEEYVVDSFWPGDPRYGHRIRIACSGSTGWSFVYQEFFERANPTCFIRYDDAKHQAGNQLYCTH